MAFKSIPASLIYPRFTVVGAGALGWRAAVAGRAGLGRRLVSGRSASRRIRASRSWRNSIDVGGRCFIAISRKIQRASRM
jgi:hypothetical protein